MTSSIQWSPAPGGYWIKFDYNVVFLEEMKKHVSYRDRRWDPKRKAWWISSGAAEQVQKIAEEVLDDYRPNKKVKFDFHPIKNTEAYIELHLWPGAPIEVAEAAYEALKKVYARDRINPRPLREAIECIRGLEPSAGVI